MKNNKNWVIVTICLIVISLSTYITYKVIRNHQNNLIKVTEKRITEAGQKCVNEEKCSKNENITLQKLYDNNYLTEESNPLTKEIYDYSSYIKFENGAYVFYSVN